MYSPIPWPPETKIPSSRGARRWGERCCFALGLLLFQWEPAGASPFLTLLSGPPDSPYKLSWYVDPSLMIGGVALKKLGQEHAPRRPRASKLQSRTVARGLPLRWHESSYAFYAGALPLSRKGVLKALFQIRPNQPQPSSAESTRIRSQHQASGLEGRTAPLSRDGVLL